MTIINILCIHKNLETQIKNSEIPQVAFNFKINMKSKFN